MRKLLLLAVLAFPVAGQIRFEAVVAGVAHAPEGCGDIHVPSFTQMVYWMNPDVIQENGGFLLASSGGSEVFGHVGRRLTRITPNGAETFFELPERQRATGLAVSSGGSIFIATVERDTWRLLVVSSTTGMLKATYPLPVSRPHFFLNLAVGADGCTLFYAEGMSIRRINGCTGTPLADFATAPDSVVDLFPIAGGQLLVTAGNNVLLYDSSGAFVRVVAAISAYASPQNYSPHQIGLSNDGETLWMIADRGCEAQVRGPALLLRIDFDTGEELSRRELPTNDNWSLVLGASATAVPTANHLVLALIALVLAAAGVIALR